MSAQERIKAAIGNLKSPARSPILRSAPLTVEAGSDEARLRALEQDVATLRDGLELAGKEIDDLGKRIGTTGE
jgi:hypothetical protein